jgi:L-cysteine:1D-myo-inositol 2-amino-2-deoxy-alpha-D-glucopyranoside ligase
VRAWTAPVVPRLPGRGERLRLHDTASDRLVETPHGETATLYVCGITPYDATHMGHASTYVAFDLANRAWRDAGHDVTYVQNVTDVDDPLLERATATGVDWVALAEQQTELFRDDMEALRSIPPAHYLGAVEAVDEIALFVEALRDKGAAYDLEGDIYFSIASAPHFGEVSHLSVAEMLTLAAERGGDPDRPGKKDPLDPLLWRSARPDEPSWPSPLGPGRPGWHVECTAIAVNRLGTTIDLQGGGSDLVFPHHEMGAAHAEVATGVWPFAHTYVHTGMVGLDGEKMSKSRGNLVFVSRLRAQGVPAAAIRLALLGHHYRGDWEWTDADLDHARQRLERWNIAVARRSGPSGAELLSAVRAAMAHDLDAPQALALIDRWADSSGDDGAAPALTRDLVDALLGVELQPS